MITIPRNHSKKIEAIKKTIVLTTSHRLDSNFEATPVDQTYAWMSLFEYKGKLTDDGDGRYTIYIHSNFWYRLYTADRIEADRKATEARAAELKQRAATTPPLPQGPTREQRQARIIARTVSIHDLGKPAATGSLTSASIRTVAGVHAAATVTRTRMAIGTQIAEACAALGIELSHGTACYVVNGRAYTVGEMADLVLIGGFAANYGGNETRPVEVAPAELLPEPTAADIAKTMGAKMSATVTAAGADPEKGPKVRHWLVPTATARLTDRHDLLGPYSADLAEHQRKVYTEEGIACEVIASVTRPTPLDRSGATTGAAVDELLDSVLPPMSVEVEAAHHEAAEMARVLESSEKPPTHPNEFAALRALRMMPTVRWRELFCEPDMVAKTSPEQHMTFRWLTTVLEERFGDAARAAQEVMYAAELALQAAGPDADPAAYVVDYVGEILTRIPFLTRREHDARGGHGCMSAEDSGLFRFKRTATPGARARCLCGRLWLRAVKAQDIPVWRPVTMFGRTP